MYEFLYKNSLTHQLSVAIPLPDFLFLSVLAPNFPANLKSRLYPLLNRCSAASRQMRSLMKNLKCFFIILSMVFTLAYLHVSVLGQSAEDKNRIASVVASGSSVRWEVMAPNSGLTVTVSAPDGQVFRKEFKAGDSPE